MRVRFGSRVVQAAAAYLLSAGLAAGATRGAPDLTPALNAFLTANPEVPGVVVTVRSGATGLDWSGAAGVADRASKTPLTPQHAFRIASVTKLFTAAAVLRLAESGRLDVDAPIARYLAAETVAALRAGGYDTDRILVRHLLAHTAGLFDYAEAPAFNAAILAQPCKRWTRSEEVALAMAKGKPLGAPGEVFGYSDTGYVLLGEIVERVTGEPLAAAVRRLVGFGRLRLAHTFWEDGRDRAAASRPSPLFKSYIGPLDTSGVDPSFDLYGGGGLVSTTRELAAFVRAAARGEVFADRGTLALAMAAPSATRPATGPVYALMGEWSTIGGEACWGHTGFFGTYAFYCPATDTTYAFHFGLGAAAVKLKPLMDGLTPATRRPAPPPAPSPSTASR